MKKYKSILGKSTYKKVSLGKTLKKLAKVVGPVISNQKFRWLLMKAHELIKTDLLVEKIVQQALKTWVI